MIFFNVIVVLFVLYLIFALSGPDCQFRTSPTALQELWSGACARQCLNLHTTQNYLFIHNNQIPYNSECSCDICYCGFFENAIRTCNPTILSFHSTMNAINEVLHNVVHTVRATYDYFCEIVHGMLNHSQMPEDDTMINVTTTSGSEETLVVTRIEKKEAVDTKDSQTSRPGAVIKSNTPSALVKTSSGPMAIIGPVATLAPSEIDPMKQETEIDANKNTEMTSPKCTRCVEKNVFCNQECPNTNNVVDRID